MAAPEAPIPTPRHQRVEDFRRRTLPALVWAVAALASVWLLTDRGRRLEYVGLARALNYEVSAGSTGRLESLAVGLYDSVQAGEVVARLDDAELSARFERSQATIRQLTAELNATKVQLLASNDQGRADWTNNLRRFQTDEEGRRLAALELRATIEAGQIEQERLALELDRARPLLDTGLIGEAEYDTLRLTHDEVRERNQENRVLLEQTEQEYRTARTRRREFEAGLPSFPAEESLLRPLLEAIEVENRRLDEIEARRASLVLRSPVTGLVSQILCTSGQTVVPGEPILTVSDPAVREIVTYLAQSDDRTVQQNQGVLVARLARPDRVAESVVLRTGPGVELLPQRLWRDPAVPDYGRAVVIAATPALALTPGELLNVRFVDGR